MPLFLLGRRGAFSASDLVKTLHQFPIDVLCCPPTIYRSLVSAACSRELKEMPPRTLRHCVSAGEPLNAEVIRQWKDSTGLDVYDGYGQVRLSSSS
jgi:medium-chain acyl-CoA synthetase